MHTCIRNSVKLRHEHSYRVETMAIASSNLALYCNNFFPEINRSRAKILENPYLRKSYDGKRIVIVFYAFLKFHNFSMFP